MFLPPRQAGRPALRPAGLPALGAKTLARLFWAHGAFGGLGSGHVKTAFQTAPRFALEPQQPAQVGQELGVARDTLLISFDVPETKAKGDRLTGVRVGVDQIGVGAMFGVGFTAATAFGPSAGQEPGVQGSQGELFKTHGLPSKEFKVLYRVEVRLVHRCNLPL